MNQKELERRLNDKKSNQTHHYTEEEKNEVALEIYHYFNDDIKNSAMTTIIEEMGELIQILSRVRRGRDSFDSLNLIEEIADVRLCLREVKCVFFGDIITEPSVNSVKRIVCDTLEITGADRDNVLDVLIMRYLSEIIFDLSSYMCDKRELVETSEKINQTNRAIEYFVLKYDLSMTDILYIEDIKVERAKDKRHQGTLI